MKQKVLYRFFNHILVMLGFASTVSCIPGLCCMYGTPTMDFEISGKVVSQKSEPIPGIKVSVPGKSSGVFTGKDGSFSISGSYIVSVLEFKDVDGPANGGEFADKKENIKVNKVENGDGNWYMGKYEAKDIVIEMEEKE